MRCFLSLVLVFLLAGNRVAASASDSLKYTIVSLDSLSDEDLALLEEYKDSFMLEVNDIKAALRIKKLGPIDTTVAFMNSSSHAEIGLNVCGPILSNGRNTGLKGVVFTPTAMYYHKTGLYAATGMNFFTDTVISKSARVPSFFISPGFYRTFFKRWTFSLNYTRSFIFYGSELQRGLLNNSFSLYNSFDFWRYITVSVSAGISWSSNLNSKKFIRIGLRKVYYRTITKDAGQAYAASIGLSIRRDFCFYNKLGAKVFTLIPDLFLLFGMDNSTLITRAVTRRGLAITSDKFFGLLNIEPGFTVDWRIKNLEIFAAVHCAIPFNEYNSDLNTRVKNPKEYYPYGEGGIKYLFRIAKPKRK